MSRDHPSYAETSNDVGPGLYSFLGRVYLKLAVGLALSAAIAWIIADVPAARAVFFRPFDGARFELNTAGWILLISPLPAMLVANFLVRDPIGAAPGPVFWLVGALIGGSMSSLALVLTGASLVSTFLVAAVTLAALSFWTFATHQNLRGFVSFGSIALFGIILALAVNLLLGSAPVYPVLNLIGVLILAGLVGSDTQRLHAIYHDAPGPEFHAALSSFGALSLYLNFINVFLIAVSSGRRRGRP